MRLSELLDCRVVEAGGRELGQVCDVRLIREELPGTSAAHLRLHELVVNPGRTGRLLGYGRNPVERPWLLHAIVRWFERDELVVRWDEVAEYRPAEVVLRPGAPARR